MIDKIVFPASGISALGCVYVCGRSFVPAPATGMIAFIRIFLVDRPLVPARISFVNACENSEFYFAGPITFFRTYVQNLL